MLLFPLVRLIPDLFEIQISFQIVCLYTSYDMSESPLLIDARECDGEFQEEYWLALDVLCVRRKNSLFRIVQQGKIEKVVSLGPSPLVSVFQI